MDFPLVEPPRNGACAVAKADRDNVRFLAALHAGVQAAAEQQDLAGEDVDDVEFHEVDGTFGWREYVRREFSRARLRIGGEVTFG